MCLYGFSFYISVTVVLPDRMSEPRENEPFKGTTAPDLQRQLEESKKTVQKTTCMQNICYMLTYEIKKKPCKTYRHFEIYGSVTKCSFS